MLEVAYNFGNICFKLQRSVFFFLSLEHWVRVFRLAWNGFLKAPAS